jgi:hypothetical protein
MTSKIRVHSRTKTGEQAAGLRESTPDEQNGRREICVICGPLFTACGHAHIPRKFALSAQQEPGNLRNLWLIYYFPHNHRTNYSFFMIFSKKLDVS